MRSTRSLLVVASMLVGCGSSGSPAAAGDAGSPVNDGSLLAPDANVSPNDAGDDDGEPTPDAQPAPDASGDDTFDAGDTTRVRLMAANLTSGTNQSYEAPGIRIFQGLHPDVVMIQEFKYAGSDAGVDDGGADLRSFVDAAFSAGYYFFVDPRVGGIPNGIVSRFPIVTSGVWVDASVTDRAFVYAQLDVPGPIDLWAVSVHLLTTSAGNRATEAAQLLGYVQSNVPAGDYLVIGGDFNTDSVGEGALTTLGATVVVIPPYPADQSGNNFSSINRNRPHDWVLPNPSLDARQTAVRIGSSVLPGGLVFDSRVYAPLTDVAPVLLGDSAADGMQHMGVVRDFLLDRDDI